jgi:Na+/H+ antiporter NhaC
LSIKSFDFFGFLKGAGDGALSMSETLIVALLSGGLLKVIRQNGGIGYLMQVIERHIQGRRGGEFGIALLVAAVNVFTANNTVAIVIAGPIAKEISDRYGIAPARSASILDATSCVIQGIIPYGAQILVAVSLAGVAVSALQLLSYLWYPYMLGLFLILAIASGYPKIKTDKAV